MVRQGGVILGDRPGVYGIPTGNAVGIERPFILVTRKEDGATLSLPCG